jgi:hypothetical protein
MSANVDEVLAKLKKEHQDRRSEFNSVRLFCLHFSQSVVDVH